MPGRIREPDVGNGLAVLTREHNRIAAMVKELKTLPGHSDGGSQEQISQRGQLVEMIATAMSRHETIENEHFWPIVRRVLPDGDSWADGAAQRQQQGQETLAALGEHPADSEEFDQLVGTLISQSHQHAAYQDHLFLELHRAMPSGELEELGETLRRAGSQDSSR
nr:hemerythrin domain-containing protein [Halopolyspora algeriensis]